MKLPFWCSGTKEELFIRGGGCCWGIVCQREGFVLVVGGGGGGVGSFCTFWVGFCAKGINGWAFAAGPNESSTALKASCFGVVVGGGKWAWN